jgi:endonuclease/exonuclease/phosphatase family metal-dependent hydrolase
MTHKRDAKNDRNFVERIGTLSVNLRFGLADDGPFSWSQRKKAYPHLFKAYPMDFIAVQEANDFQVEELDHLLVDYQFIGLRKPAPRFWQNNVIFYRAPWRCIANDYFFLSPTPDLPSRARNSRWPRQCTMGIFCRGQTEIICINTHLDFNPEIQTQSARIILERLQRWPTVLPAFLMGDFNAPPTAECLAVLTAHAASERTCRQRFKSAFKAPFGGTFHNFTGNANGKHIDWILYRGHLRIEASEIVKKSFEGVFPSDHFPICARFELLNRC